MRFSNQGGSSFSTTAAISIPSKIYVHGLQCTCKLLFTVYIWYHFLSISHSDSVNFLQAASLVTRLWRSKTVYKSFHICFTLLTSLTCSRVSSESKSRITAHSMPFSPPTSFVLPVLPFPQEYYPIHCDQNGEKLLPTWVFASRWGNFWSERLLIFNESPESSVLGFWIWKKER